MEARWLPVLTSPKAGKDMGIMEKKMETTVILRLYWGYIRIMEKKMETSVILRL